MPNLEKLSASFPQSLDQNQRSGNFITLLSHTLTSACLMSTSFHLGITEGKAAVKEGDEVWILFGCLVPMILQRDGTAFIVVCPTYVHKFMDGQTVEGIRSPEKSNTWPEVLRTGSFRTYEHSYVSAKGIFLVEIIRLK